MNIMAKAKEGVGFLRDKGVRLLGALGGRIEGSEKLPDEEAALIRRRAGRCVLSAFGGFFFAGTEAAFGSLPFAAALLCAAGHSGAFFVYAGALAGSLVYGNGAFAQITVLTLMFISRIVLSPSSDITGRRLFEEGLKIKLMISATAAFLLGIYNVVSLFEVDRTRAILAFVFSLVVTPLLTFLYNAALDVRQNNALHEAGMSAVLFTVVFSLAAHTFFGYSFAASASFLMILTVGHSYGVLRGSLCGLICALACGVNPVIFALAGFAAGAFRPFGPVAGTTVALVGAVGTKIYLGGITNAYVFAGDVLFASLIFIPLAKTGFIGKILPPDSENVTSSVAETAASDKKREDEKRRLASLSRAFDELSQAFVKLSASLCDPSLYELREICDNAFDRFCRKCSLVSYCWQKNYEDMNDGINKLTEIMRDKGRLESSDMPEFIARRCRNIDRILGEINRGRADIVENALKRDKTELFALDYEAISELLRDSSSERGRFTVDNELQNKAAKTIRSLGVRSMAYGAWGDRSKTILATGVEIGSITVTSKEIKNALERATGLKLTEPDFNFSGEFVAMTLHTAKRYSVSCARSVLCADGENVSGDNALSFESVNDYSYSCICDGMGSGSEAASVSGISAMFFEKMLGAGNCVPVTLKLLSNFIRARSDEYHCTADIVEIDLYSAKANFIKCGAPASYVIRSGNIFKIDARSIPLGITKEITSEIVSMDLQSGDRVVMVSDGVAPDLEGALWLPELLVSCADRPDSELAGIVSKRARAENGGADDISVLVMSVNECE